MADLPDTLAASPDRVLLERRASPAGARVGAYLGRITGAVRCARNYVRTHDFASMRRDAEFQVRRRPVSAVLLGLGAGYIAAKLIRR